MKKLVKIFKSIWEQRDEKDDLKNTMIQKLLKNDKVLPKEELKGFTDGANVLMIVPKKKMMIEFIKENFDVADEIRDFNSLKLKYDVEKFGENKSKFNGELLGQIFAIAENYETVEIKMRENYPLWVETEDFIMILAPRVTEEDGD